MDNEKDQKGTAEELDAYEKLRQRLSRILGELQDRLNAETISQAMDKAAAELKEMGEHSMEALNRAGESLKKDIASTAMQLKPGYDEVKGDARKRFEDWHDKGGALWREIASEGERFMELSRDKGGAFLLNVTEGLRDWSSRMSQKLDSSLQYRSGEITHGGEFACLRCGAKIHLKKPGRIPPCPKCTAADFRRS